MDRRVKERLVGASILVVLIVLIVPELLSGPAAPAAGPKLPVSAPEQVRNVTVDLAGARAPGLEPAIDPAGVANASPQQAHAQGTAPNAASGAAAPGSAAIGEAQGAGTNAQPAAAAPPPAAVMAPPAAEPLETPPPAPTKTTSAPGPKSARAGHGWDVQLGSFASRANAEKLAHQVKEQGFAVYVSSGGSGPSLRYRVRIGPMADHNAASQAAAKLRALGHPSSLVPPAR